MSTIEETKKMPEAYPEKMSKGERLFNWLTYGGIAGVVTFLLSIPVGYWARYNAKGQSSIKWLAKHLNKAGMSEHTAEDIVMTTALMQGGNATIPPVKMMEDRKPELVEKFNRMLGDKSDAETIANEPKQTWGSLLNARIFLAWTPVFLSLRGASLLFGKETFDGFEKKFAKYLLCKPLGKPTHRGGEETKLFKIGRIAAVDVFATTAAAILLYIGSRIFAKKPQKQSPFPPTSPKQADSATPSDCISCRRRPFADALAPAASFAEAAAGDKAKPSEAYLA